MRRETLHLLIFFPWNLSDMATSTSLLLFLCHPKPNHSLHLSAYFFSNAKVIAWSNTASSVSSPMAVMNENPRDCSDDPIENEWPEPSRRVAFFVLSSISTNLLRLRPFRSNRASGASDRESTR